ncbi:MAG: orc1/cdc6 family replication initiation protein [Candidatus Aenigmarchaeota archaeon]|nr:orc1/cdc6 family replication initiation protein [Candidatus Aenigmarchaeota archaeon]
MEDIDSFVSTGTPYETKVPRENVFNVFMGKKSIFKDKDMLASSFMPDDILHRDDEITQISSVLAPAIRGYKPNNLFIYGNVGTGKTITTRFVLTQLSHVSGCGHGIKVVYVNCRMKNVADTEYRLVAQLLKEFGVYVPDTGISTNTLYKRFFEEVELYKGIIIIALDEIDTIFKKIGDDFLYNLTRIGSELEHAKIAIIGITNDLSFYDGLDTRVKSSLGEDTIIFKPYNALQLHDILIDRAKAGLYNLPDEGVINKCAAIAAQEHGDARRALDLLRVAAEISERHGDEWVEENHVDMAQEKIELDHIIETVRSQPKHSLALIHSVIKMNEENAKKNGWADRRLLTGDIYDKYKKICDAHAMRPLTQRRVSDLIGELDMMGILNTRVVSKGRYGRTRVISLAIPNNLMARVNNIINERFCN